MCLQLGRDTLAIPYLSPDSGKLQLPAVKLQVEAPELAHGR